VETATLRDALVELLIVISGMLMFFKRNRIEGCRCSALHPEGVHACHGERHLAALRHAGWRHIGDGGARGRNRKAELEDSRAAGAIADAEACRDAPIFEFGLTVIFTVATLVEPASTVMLLIVISPVKSATIGSEAGCVKTPTGKVVKALPVMTTFNVWPCVPELGATPRRAGVAPSP